MENLRVDDVDTWVAELEAAGVKSDPKRKEAAYGNSPGSGIRRGTGWSCGSRLERRD